MRNKEKPNTIKKRSVLIFGAYGLLGSDLSDVFSKKWNVLRIGHEDTDITNEKAVISTIKKHSPTLIINAAAYNKVEETGETISLSYKVNAFGPFYIAKIADKLNIPFVHFSTNYIFDGSKDIYLENDFPDPINIYGASKFAGEQLVKIISKQYYIIRTSSLFGNKKSTKGSDFISKMLELSYGDTPIKVVDDQFMSPTFSVDLAQKIYEMIEKPSPFGIYNITNSGSASWFEFAKEIFTIKGIKSKLVAISTTESGTKIQRPKKCILINEKLVQVGLSPMPTWQNAIRRHLNYIK